MIARLGMWGSAMLLAGCATQWTGLSSDNASPAGPLDGLPVRFQQSGLEVSGMLLRTITVDSLVPGDILLSSSPQATSSVIRLGTFSTVSHSALYVGDGRLVEAVGGGIRVRPLGLSLVEGDTIVAYRVPELTATHRDHLVSFALSKVGQPYNHLGIVMHAPLSLERRLCELPGIPGTVREACLRTFAAVQLAPGAMDTRDSYFCSQLVMASYRAAGWPLSEAPNDAIAPVDLLHMREGDVPSYATSRPLAYVGRLIAQGADIPETPSPVGTDPVQSADSRQRSPRQFDVTRPHDQGRPQGDETEDRAHGLPDA